jgi:hypothetical protein
VRRSLLRTAPIGPQVKHRACDGENRGKERAECARSFRDQGGQGQNGTASPAILRRVSARPPQGRVSPMPASGLPIRTPTVLARPASTPPPASSRALCGPTTTLCAARKRPHPAHLVHRPDFHRWRAIETCSTWAPGDRITKVCRAPSVFTVNRAVTMSPSALASIKPPLDRPDILPPTLWVFSNQMPETVPSIATPSTPAVAPYWKRSAVLHLGGTYRASWPLKF